MEEISLNEDVVTGNDMENGYLPPALYTDEAVIIEVTNCGRERGGWYRNVGADEWAFQ